MIIVVNICMYAERIQGLEIQVVFRHQSIKESLWERKKIRASEYKGAWERERSRLIDWIKLIVVSMGASIGCGFWWAHGLSSMRCASWLLLSMLCLYVHFDPSCFGASHVLPVPHITNLISNTPISLIW